MPQEIIKDAAMNGFHTVVKWRSDPDREGVGHVQLGTVNQHSPFAFAPGGEPVVVTTNAAGPRVVTDGTDALTGWFITLEPAQLRALRRALRKAHRQAFGLRRS